MSDQDTLEDALDGLINAVKYAEDIGEEDLAREISVLYQKLGQKSPSEHWESVYRCRVSGGFFRPNIKQSDKFMIIEEDKNSDTIEIYATSEGISDLESREGISEVEVLDNPHSEEN